MIIYISHFFTAIVGRTFVVFKHTATDFDKNPVYVVVIMILLLLLLLFYYTGAEWWAQPFGKSLPFLSWLPYLEGKTSLYSILSVFGPKGFVSVAIYGSCYTCSKFICNVKNVFSVSPLLKAFHAFGENILYI